MSLEEKDVTQTCLSRDGVSTRPWWPQCVGWRWTQGGERLSTDELSPLNSRTPDGEGKVDEGFFSHWLYHWKGDSLVPYVMSPGKDTPTKDHMLPAHKGMTQRFPAQTCPPGSGRQREEKRPLGLEQLVGTIRMTTQHGGGLTHLPGPRTWPTCSLTHENNYSNSITWASTVYHCTSLPNPYNNTLSLFDTWGNRISARLRSLHNIARLLRRRQQVKSVDSRL